MKKTDFIAYVKKEYDMDVLCSMQKYKLNKYEKLGGRLIAPLNYCLMLDTRKANLIKKLAIKIASIAATPLAIIGVFFKKKGEAINLGYPIKEKLVTNHRELSDETATLIQLSRLNSSLPSSLLNIKKKLTAHIDENIINKLGESKMPPATNSAIKIRLEKAWDDQMSGINLRTLLYKDGHLLDISDDTTRMLKIAKIIDADDSDWHKEIEKYCQNLMEVTKLPIMSKKSLAIQNEIRKLEDNLKGVYKN